MSDYMIKEKKDGTIEFWTNDDELRLRVAQMIADIADAICYRRQIRRIDNRIDATKSDKERGE